MEINTEKKLTDQGNSDRPESTEHHQLGVKSLLAIGVLSSALFTGAAHALKAIMPNPTQEQEDLLSTWAESGTPHIVGATSFLPNDNALELLSVSRTPEGFTIEHQFLEIPKSLGQQQAFEHYFTSEGAYQSSIRTAWVVEPEVGDAFSISIVKFAAIDLKWLQEVLDNKNFQRFETVPDHLEQKIVPTNGPYNPDSN